MISETAFHIFGGFFGNYLFSFFGDFFFQKIGGFLKEYFLFLFLFIMAKNSPNENLKLLEMKTMKIKIISLFQNSYGLFAP
jgi:hypothetical protein